VTSAASCARCGTALSPAASFITEGGALCQLCFARYQNEADARRVAEEISEKRARAARRNAHTHGVVWLGVGLLTVFSHFRSQTWLAAIVFIASFALRRGLGTFSRAAFFVALGLDAVAALGLLALAATWSEWGFVVVAIFPAFLFVLTWTVRDAYSKASS
jgi:hypothetical protein